MAVYRCPNGKIYNLDKFTLFYIDTTHKQGPGIDESASKLIGETVSGTRIIIHSGLDAEAEEECKRELNEINRALIRPVSVMVSFDEDTKYLLREELRKQ